jgi:GWxTD domain-containing protein
MQDKDMQISKLLKLFLFVILFGAISCKGPMKVTVDRNFADMYNPGSSRLHPDYNIYNSSDDSSELLIKIFPVELLYYQDSKAGNYAGKVRIDYMLSEFDGEGRTQVADSGMYTYNFIREEAGKRFIGRIPIRADTGKIYELKVKATDMVRKDEYQRFLIVDKRSRFSQQNFMVLNGDQNMLYFAPYVIGNNTFTIRYRDKGYSKVYISYYGGDTPLPKPTFSSASDAGFFEKPDSVWILPFNNDLKYMLKYEGLYHFRLDTAFKEGLTIFNFGESFPKVTRPEQLVGPLAYLTSSSEYEKLTNSTNQKLAFDNFWLNKTDNIEKARELIRIYFNRVYFANYYFTSYKAGWKTDRGMVYIIYGPPQTIYRNNSQEKWIYYRKSITTSITFTFDYCPSPYTVNNYVLQRSESNEWHWREAIDSWRRGKVFLLD